MTKPAINAHSKTQQPNVDFSETSGFASPLKLRLTDDTLSYVLAVAITGWSEESRLKARKFLESLLQQWPEIGEKVLDDTKIAIRSTNPITRSAAQQILWVLIEKCPHIIGADLIESAAQVATTDRDVDVRSAAQRTLEILAWSVAC